MRSTTWRTGLTISAAGLAAAALVAAPAQAATKAQPSAAEKAATTATAVSKKLGDNATAGSYLDSATGKMVVTITHNSDAQAVTAAGATPKLVTRSEAQLKAVKSALGKLHVPGTARGIDPLTNQVYVKADSTVTGANLSKVQAAVNQQGAAARLQRVTGKFSTRIAGGDTIEGTQFRCSLGFNVTDGSFDYFLTAGHCGNDEPEWWDQSGNFIGETLDSEFPGDDFAIIGYEGSVSPAGSVDLYNGQTQDITRAGDAFVGESVKRSGSTSHVHSGTVLGTDVEVDYDDGTFVTGTIDTNVCAEPGDSGGSLFSGSTAVGLTSGGSGDCTFGGETFFQPVTEALDFYGVNVF
jgi:streptogrisin D